MHIALVLAACGIMQIINLTTEPWNSLDMETMKRAEIVCKANYGTCVARFIKVKPREYKVLCK